MCLVNKVSESKYHCLQLLFLSCYINIAITNGMIRRIKQHLINYVQQQDNLLRVIFTS